MSDKSNKILRLVRSTALFAPIVDEFEIANAAALNRQLIDVITAWRGSESGINRSNYDGWHSKYDLFDRPEEPVRHLCQFIQAASRVALGRHWDKTDLEQRKLLFFGWANVNGQHAFNTIHAHSGYHFSGVYYVKVPRPTKPFSGSLQFINSQASSSGPNQELWNKMFPGQHTVVPQEGRLLIFPSTLKHWVYPNAEDEDRISIAFNVVMP